MIGIRKRREAYSFTDRDHPKEGIFSVAIGIVLLVVFLVLFLVTSRKQGGMVVGILGILVFAGAILGIRLAWKAMKKEDIYYRFPVIGILINGMVVIISVSLYVAGLVSN